EVDDVVLKRFLRHRKLDVEKASDSFLKYLTWRNTFVPNGSISESEIQNQLALKKLFLQGFDKKGRPIAVVFQGRDVPTNGKKSLDELKRYMVYILDKICARMSNGQEQFTAIVDLKGWGFSNFDLNATPLILSMLQEYYPETVGQIYMINQPFTLRAVWKIVSPFIRSNTKKKFVFVDNNKVTQTLVQDIDEDQLPEIYGGKLPLVVNSDNVGGGPVWQQRYGSGLWISDKSSSPGAACGQTVKTATPVFSKRGRKRMSFSVCDCESVEMGSTSSSKDVNKQVIINMESSTTITTTDQIVQQQKLDLMRSFVEKQDPTSKEVDDVVLKRFLRHRKLDVEKASESFLKYRSWRNTFVPNGSISESEIQNQLSHKKLFMQGFDKKGRPLAVFFQERDVPTNGKKSLDERKRFLVYSLDKICARMSNGHQEQFSVIVDLKGWGLSNLDLNAVPVLLSILQEYYPETVEQMYLINQPFTIRAVWKIVSPFIRSNTKKKFVFVDNKKVTPTLLQDIDEDQLPEIYGGKLPLVPVEDF
ncbi:Phosphatidylinositol transfer protein, partial [Thalictrum thalictroides]